MSQKINTQKRSHEDGLLYYNTCMWKVQKSCEVDSQKIIIKISWAIWSGHNSLEFTHVKTKQLKQNIPKCSVKSLSFLTHPTRLGTTLNYTTSKEKYLDLDDTFLSRKVGNAALCIWINNFEPSTSKQTSGTHLNTSWQPH